MNWRLRTAFLCLSCFFAINATGQASFSVTPTKIYFEVPEGGVGEQTITVHNNGKEARSYVSAVGNPTFTIDEENEFADGVTVTQNGALTVFATQDYDINVQASGSFSSGTRTIPINRLRIGVSNAGGTITQPVQLVATGAQIVNEAPATLQKSLNLQYLLQGGAHLLNFPNGSYTTTLTYTITAD